MAANPWLRVNKFGERYENEDVPIQACSIQIQPDRKAWAIFDDNYPNDVQKSEDGFARVIISITPTLINNSLQVV